VRGRRIRGSAGDLDARLGLGPPGARDRGARDGQLRHPRPHGPVRAAEPGQQRPAHLDGPVHLPGQREHLGQRLVDRRGEPDVVRARQRPSAQQRVLGAGQRAHGQIPPPGRQEQRPRPGRAARVLGQFGGLHAPRAGQAGMGLLHRGQGPAGQLRPLRREQPGQHRLMGQRVPEPEAA
jgi:hypothetical protein